jgi:hypothetical protein
MDAHCWSTNLDEVPAFALCFRGFDESRLDSSRRQRPEDGRPGEVAAVLRRLRSTHHRALGAQRVRARTLDVLTDLVGSFGPNPDVARQDGVRPEDLPALLRSRVESLRPIPESLRADSSAPDVQELAQDLVEYLADEG